MLGTHFPHIIELASLRKTVFGEVFEDPPRYSTNLSVCVFIYIYIYAYINIYIQPLRFAHNIYGALREAGGIWREVVSLQRLAEYLGGSSKTSPKTVLRRLASSVSFPETRRARQAVILMSGLVGFSSPLLCYSQS